MEKQEVEEEILALQSIFGDDVEVKSNGTLVTYGRDSNQVTLTIGSTYPNEPPVIAVSDHLQVLGLQVHLITMATSLIGTPMLFAVLDAAKDWMEENEAKIKKALLKKETVCKYFLQGKCRFGVHCINLHPGASLQPKAHTGTQPDSQSMVMPSKVKQKEQKIIGSPSKKVSNAEPQPACEEGEETKKERMRTATEVISRILWDPDLPADQFSVGYLDRFIGIQEKAFKEFSWDDISSVGADVLAVPKHRIQYFKYKGRIVWDKRNQTDDFFGSRGGNTIDQIVDKPEPFPEADVKKNDTEKEEEIIELDLIDDDEDEDQPLAHGHSKQDRPTHFMCIQITDDEVKASINEVVSHVTRLSPQLAKGIIQPSALHVTLCMVRLSNDEQIEIAKRVFESCRLQFLKLLPRCVKLEFTGVDNFRGRLIYVKVKPLPGLERFVFHVIEQLQTAGLKTPGNHKEYTPHITLVKLSRPMQREMCTKLIDPSCYQPYLTKSLGCQPVTSIHLCSMHAPAQSDGFYLRYAKITNSLLGLPNSLVILVEQKLLQLKDTGYLGEHECEVLIGELHQSVSLREETRFDKVIEEFVQVSKEARTFESSSTSSPTVVIMRGLPGSGKSHLLTHSLEAMSNPSKVAVISADSFFTEGSDYKFNPSAVFKAHLGCISQFLDALLCSEKSVVAIDNTNSQSWEYYIYTYLCQVLGLICHILEVPCPTSALAERFRCRNQHKIQSSAVNRMLQRWEEDSMAVFVPPTLAYPRDWSDVHPLPYSLLSLCRGQFTPLPEVIKTSKSLVAVYSGVFLTTKSQWELLSMFQPSHSNIHASHVTLTFEPCMSTLRSLPVGKNVKIGIVGHAENSKVQACVVELPHRYACDNKKPHITVSTIEGVSPKTANTMLQNQIIHRCDSKVLKGIVGVVVRQATEEEKEGKEPPGEKLASMPSYVVTSINDLKAILPQLLILSDSEDSDGVLKENAPAILTGDQKITKLFIFDFDGTLTIPPGPVEGKRLYEQETGRKWPHKGWLGWPESLLPPMRVLPGPALAEFRNHVNRADSYTIVLTGRVENTKVGVMKVLENFQIFPDKVYFKPDITDESTADFKQRMVKQLLAKDFPNVTLVKFWDDMPENLRAMNWLSQNAAVNHIQFEVIDSTKMSSTTGSKHGKKVSVKKPDIHTSRIQHESFLQKHLSVYGFQPTPEYQMAAQEGIEFIAKQFSSLIDYQGNPLNLLYVFGSYPIHRVSDVDMCLIAPDTQTQIDWIKKMASQLQTCGIKHIHVGHSSRCPRLKVNLMYSDSFSIEYDMVIALIGNKEYFANPIKDQLHATELVKMKNPGDSATKVAMSGPLFMQKIEEVLLSKGIEYEVFGAVVEMVVQILIARREKGNAYHCIRTFHIVQLLVEFIKQEPRSVSLSSANINCDELFHSFINYTSELEYEKWEKLFGDFVPDAYIPRLMAVFKECSHLLKPGELPSEEYYEELVKRVVYPPDQYLPVDIKISGKDSVLKWKAGIIVEARLPSYIRQLISHGLDIRSDGNIKNSCKYSYSVPPLKSAKDILQQILRPFWGELVELRKQDGLNIQLNFGQTTTPSSDPVSSALESLTENSSKDPKSSALLEQVINFASSSTKSGPKELHLPTTLTAHARLLVHEAAERLGLEHSSVGSGKNRHIVLKKPNNNN